MVRRNVRSWAPYDKLSHFTRSESSPAPLWGTEISRTETELRHFISTDAKSHLAASAGTKVNHLTRIYLEELLSQRVVYRSLANSQFHDLLNWIYIAGNLHTSVTFKILSIFCPYVAIFLGSSRHERRWQRLAKTVSLYEAVCRAVLSFESYCNLDLDS